MLSRFLMYFIHKCLEIITPKSEKERDEFFIPSHAVGSSAARLTDYLLVHDSKVVEISK
jgi:hypothetical protein